MLWFNEARDSIKTDNPGISFIDVAKKGGEIWKKMTSSDKEVNHDDNSVNILVTLLSKFNILVKG